MAHGNVSAVQAASGNDARTAPVVRPPIGGGGQPQAPPVSEVKAQKQGQPAEVSLKQAQAIAEAVNQRADFNKFQARVAVDEATNTFVFQIHTREGGKLIRQFPPEGILFFARQLEAAGPNGILLDDAV